MKNNWKTTTIGDLISVKRGYDLTSKDRNVGNIPVYGAAGQNGFHNESKVNGPGIVIGRSGGSFGQVHYVEHESFWPHNTAMYVTDFNGNDVDFVFYLLKTLDFSALNSGSAQPSLNRNYLYPVKVKAPHLDEQILIGQLLSSLDNKIELNNKINAELEAMAKLIYDYWFVQFDFPDANGKPYKSSGGKMVFNEELQREIPEGWQATTLGAICDLYQPKTISEKEMDENGKYLVYGANGVVGKYSQFNHEKSVVTITCRGNSCGTLNTTRPFSWITGNAMVVNNKCETMHVEFIHNMLSWSNLDAVISGSAQPQITRTNLAPLRLLLPPKSILAEYNKTISSNFEKRLILANENDQLISLRDWLLPMLMNGQVTISTK